MSVQGRKAWAHGGARLTYAIAATALLALLAACGGGGGADSGSSDPNSVAAYANFMRNMVAYGYGSALPYARSQETQADELGLMLAAAACFDPRESVPLWERMDRNSGGGAPPEFASTHPSAGTRIQQLQALMPKALAYQAKFCETAASTAR